MNPFKLLQLKSKRRPMRLAKSVDQAKTAILAKEAAIGGTLFGPVPEGVNRAFFCKDGRTWVWQEAWVDINGRPQTLTTTYQVEPDVILKTQGNLPPQVIDAAEAQNFDKAVEWYHRLVMRNIYHQLV